jgi:hypothetical protein
MNLVSLCWLRRDVASPFYSPKRDGQFWSWNQPSFFQTNMKILRVAEGASYVSLCLGLVSFITSQEDILKNEADPFRCAQSTGCMRFQIREASCCGAS